INETCPLQPLLDFGVAHKKPPDALGTIILDPNNNRALIDTQFIGVVPLLADVKGVAEAISGPQALATVVIKVTQRGQTVFGSKGHGAARSRGCNGAVITLRRRRAASTVAARPITRG